jgi:hypothetical protein
MHPIVGYFEFGNKTGVVNNLPISLNVKKGCESLKRK